MKRSHLQKKNTKKVRKDINTRFSCEHAISDNQITPSSLFWLSRQEGYVTGQNGKKIYWASWCHSDADTNKNNSALLIVNGRSESVYKYQETILDLYNQGHDIYSFDHRGQGLSDRLLSNTQVGYVDQFEDYICDMALLVSFFNLSHYTSSFIFAHSMGGLIATRYLQTHKNTPFSALVLSAPLFGINFPKYIKPVASLIFKIMASLQITPDYAPTQRPYQVVPFEQNHLTHSEVRHKWIIDLLKTTPKLQLGGASAHWVDEVVYTANLAIEDASNIVIPTLLLQTEREQIVDNSAQDQFIQNLNSQSKIGELIVISDSFHEPLFEIDAIRHPTLKMICDFYDGYTTK